MHCGCLFFLIIFGREEKVYLKGGMFPSTLVPSSSNNTRLDFFTASFLHTLVLSYLIPSTLHPPYFFFSLSFSHFLSSITSHNNTRR